MKYWNKDKRIRQQHWYQVAIKTPLSNGVFPHNEIKRTLQLSDSPGRFYLYYAGRYVWFEREQDAMWFSLRQP
jgi:hypothetical protein